MDPRRSGNRRTRAGAAALLLIALFGWVAIFADGARRPWWLLLGALLVLAVIRDLIKERPGPPAVR